MYFRNYGLPKWRLEKYLKSAISQYPLTRKMIKALKHISNQKDGTFIILIDH